MPSHPREAPLRQERHPRWPPIPPASSASRPFILFTTGATSYELVRYLGSRAGGELLLARRHYARTPGGLVPSSACAT